MLRTNSKNKMPGLEKLTRLVSSPFSKKQEATTEVKAETFSPEIKEEKQRPYGVTLDDCITQRQSYIDQLKQAQSQFETTHSYMSSPSKTLRSLLTVPGVFESLSDLLDPIKEQKLQQLLEKHLEVTLLNELIQLIQNNHYQQILKLITTHDFEKILGKNIPKLIRDQGLQVISSWVSWNTGPKNTTSILPIIQKKRDALYEAHPELRQIKNDNHKINQEIKKQIATEKANYQKLLKNIEFEKDQKQTWCYQQLQAEKILFIKLMPNEILKYEKSTESIQNRLAQLTTNEENKLSNIEQCQAKIEQQQAELENLKTASKPLQNKIQQLQDILVTIRESDVQHAGSSMLESLSTSRRQVDALSQTIQTIQQQINTKETIYIESQETLNKLKSLHNELNQISDPSVETVNEITFTQVERLQLIHDELNNLTKHPISLACLERCKNRATQLSIAHQDTIKDWRIRAQIDARFFSEHAETYLKHATQLADLLPLSAFISQNSLNMTTVKLIQKKITKLLETDFNKLNAEDKQKINTIMNYNSSYALMRACFNPRYDVRKSICQRKLKQAELSGDGYRQLKKTVKLYELESQTLPFGSQLRNFFRPKGEQYRNLLFMLTLGLINQKKLTAKDARDLIFLKPKIFHDGATSQWWSSQESYQIENIATHRDTHLMVLLLTQMIYRQDFSNTIAQLKQIHTNLPSPK